MKFLFEEKGDSKILPLQNKSRKKTSVWFIRSTFVECWVIRADVFHRKTVE